MGNIKTEFTIDENTDIWTLTVGRDRQTNEWFLCSFPDTDCQTVLASDDQTDVISLLMDHLSAIFSIDSGCEDERLFWKAVQSARTDCRYFRQNKMDFDHKSDERIIFLDTINTFLEKDSSPSDVK
jgi:hypothetical protein